MANTVITSPVLTRVTSSATQVPFIAARSGRMGLRIHNDSTAELRICEGGTASLTNYSAVIAAGGFWEAKDTVFAGAITGIWAAANGAAQVVELV